MIDANSDSYAYDNFSVSDCTTGITNPSLGLSVGEFYWWRNVHELYFNVHIKILVTIKELYFNVSVKIGIEMEELHLYLKIENTAMIIVHRDGCQKGFICLLQFFCK